MRNHTQTITGKALVKKTKSLIEESSDSMKESLNAGLNAYTKDEDMADILINMIINASNLQTATEVLDTFFKEDK